MPRDTGEVDDQAGARGRVVIWGTRKGSDDAGEEKNSRESKADVACEYWFKSEALI